MPKPPKELTPEERAARAERARANGQLGGRPPKSPFNKAQKIIAASRAKGQAALSEIVDYMLEIVRGQHEDATHDHRIRAGEFIANRCGMPVRTDLAIGGGDDMQPLRIVNAMGWRDPEGKMRDEQGRELEEDGSVRDHAGRAETPGED